MTNNLNLPQPIVDAVLNDDYSPGDADISVTSLIAPPRLVALRKKYAEQVESDVSEHIYALLGKAMHTVLERADASAIKEQRLFSELDGWVYSGQFDRMALFIQRNNWVGRLKRWVLREKPLYILQDYKMASVWEYIYGVKEERIQQLNIYAHLARLNGYKVEKLQVIYIFRDWSMSKARFDSQYPQNQVAVIDIPLWTESECETFIRNRIAIHKHAQSFPFLSQSQRELPECTDSERWYKGTDWAVMKPGNKKATRVFDSEEEAAEYIEEKQLSAEIVERPGENTRCEYYCPVRSVCTQHNKQEQAA